MHIISLSAARGFLHHSLKSRCCHTAHDVLHIHMKGEYVPFSGNQLVGEVNTEGFDGAGLQVLTVSLAALGSLMWLRKSKPASLVPIIYASAGIVATMPSIIRFGHCLKLTLAIDCHSLLQILPCSF